MSSLAVYGHFDPPRTPGPFRRNEVMLRTEAGQEWVAFERSRSEGWEAPGNIARVWPKRVHFAAFLQIWSIGIRIS